MKALVATSSGGLRVIGFNNRRSIDVSGEICHETNNPVVKILRFNDTRGYIVILRHAGAIQLYESHDYERYKLVKEWKNNCSNAEDSILSVEILHKQYLYSCSRDGRLIVRDLIHDDEELRSYKCYKLDGPIVRINVKYCDDYLHIAANDKTGGLKLYKISLASTYADHGSVDSVGKALTAVHASIGSVGYLRAILRTREASGGHKDKSKVMPYWRAQGTDHSSLVEVIEWGNMRDTEKGGVEHDVDSEISSSQLLLESSNLIFCGTQTGEIMVYHRLKKAPLKVLKVSSMPIRYLKLHGNRLYYADLLSRLGYLEWGSFESKAVDFKFGPVESLKIDFIADYIRLTVSTLMGGLAIYKIRNATVSIKYKLNVDCVINDFELLNS